MQLINHIAYRFLTDEKFIFDLISQLLMTDLIAIRDGSATEDQKIRIQSLFLFLNKENQSAYYITNTVIEKLALLKVSTKNSTYDWSVFDKIDDRKLTFILKDNIVYRVGFYGEKIHICVIYYSKFSKNEKIPEWNNIVVMRNKKEVVYQNSSMKDKPFESTIYKLLCFFFLSENTEIIVNGGKSYGTRKQPDALSNDLDIPVTIVNSNWNITSIRTEGFAVSGHFAIRRCGKERLDSRMVFIEPYEKKGYVRKAKKDGH